LTKRNLFTNYDAVLSIRTVVSDNPDRFSFLAYCVLTGSFNAVKRSGFSIDGVVNDKYKLDVMECIFLKTDPVYQLIKSQQKDLVEATLDVLSKEYSKNLFDEMRNVTFDLSNIHIAKFGDIDIYALSLKFAFGMQQTNPNLKVALNDLGQRFEQRLINLYKNDPKLCSDISKRSPQNYKDCLRKEYEYTANSLEDVYEKYVV